MTSKDQNCTSRSCLDLKNHILESYSSSLKRNLTSSLLTKRSSETIHNVILQTNKMSLQNEIIGSSYLKRKYDQGDLISSKRKPTTHTASAFDQGIDLISPATCLLQKECSQRLFQSEAELKITSDTVIVEKVDFDLQSPDESSPAICQMPHYAFSPLVFSDVQQNEFHTAKDKLTDYMNEKKNEEELLKVTFLTLVSTSLMYSPNFRDLKDEFFQLLYSKAEEVATQYPEFILKVALYTRQELNIRSTANFLLAYAASTVNCRPYLKRYFKTSVCLPSDWLAVAEICKKLSQQEATALPSALRKVMVDAFLKFDNYQLAKYNRDPVKNKKRKQKKHLKQEIKKGVVAVETSAHDQEDRVTSEQIYTLKRLIKLLHIAKPVEYVMCILGKKYPLDFESFKKSNLPGNWEEEKAGKRMKLPVPVTWETEVSKHGNKAAVWEKLIDKRKLPYMAMLRNIRNLIITGISKSHHSQVLKKLCDEKSVVKSRQFPLRFFSAYEAIHQLELIESGSGPATYLVPKKGLPSWKKKFQERLNKRRKNFDSALLKKYRIAIDEAVEIACCHNVNPIQGRTLVICDVLSCCKSECSSLKGSVINKMYEACILLGMMISYAAEECEVKLIKDPERWHTVNVKNGSILKTVFLLSRDTMDNETEDTIENAVDTFYDEKFERLLQCYLQPASVPFQFDQIVLLTSGKYFDYTNGDDVMNDFVKKYRMYSNKHLLYVKVDLTGKQNITPKISDPNDVMLSGFSDQLLRFISERGSGQQLQYVENIDRKYELKPLPKARPTCDDKRKTLQSGIISGQMQKWETVKVFISSTFKDMHGERDLIVRYIIPELRARAKTLHINIQEVDLRWGVTEAESSSNKALEICLSEATRCEFFIGILSERYGNVSDYIVPDSPEFHWLKEYPPGASLTELEIYCAALSNPSAAANTSFFYFRDKAFLDTIPELWKADFFEKLESSCKNLNILKQKIKHSGLEVFENYPCTWGGVVNGVPVVANLEEFGERVLQNLWNALCKLYRKEEMPLIDQKISPLHSFYAEAFQPIIGQVDFIELCTTSILRNDGIFLITGNPGCGKTALMRELSKENKLQPNFPYFFGIDSRACYIHNMLNDLALSLHTFFEFENIPTTDYQDLVNTLPSILENAINSSPTSTLIIFIDGLDQLMNESEEFLDWLPCSLPKGLKMIFSASQTSSMYRKISEKLMNYKPYYEFVMNSLSLPERQQFVTIHLEPHHKVLDKSPFNNQLLMLTSKRDAGYPLYLYLACEELRTFGIFEKLSAKIRNYPQTLSLLLKEILTQLENFHGKSILRMTLSLLSISPEGLTENELHILLSIISTEKTFDLPFEIMTTKVRNLKPENLLPPLKFSSLLRTLRGLLQLSGNYSSDTLRITHGEILKSVQEIYLNKYSRKIIIMLHRLIAAYFYNELVPQEFGVMFEETSVRSFRLLPYHLIQSEQFNELCSILCTVNYIKSALKAGIRSEILDHYLMLKEIISNSIQLETVINSSILKKLEDYYCFVSCNLHILQSYPHLIHQQALNEPYYSSVYKDCSGYPEARMMRWVTKPQTQTLCYRTLSDFKQAIVTVAASPDGKTAALGAENGAIYIVSISTGKLLRTFTGHSQIICCLCFIGGNQLCSGSADCTLSIWDIEKGYRIHILTGHNRRISACCNTPCGRNIISVSWDCTLCIWNAKDGKQLNVIKKTKHPLTCLSHHPHQALVVTGGWDRKLQIWDLVNVTKKATLKGHSASVRSVAFSPCGQTIASASFNGELFYWSVAQGIQIGKIADDGYPATCLSFTTSGDMLISGSNENTLKIWSYKRGEILQEAGIDGHKINCITFLSLEYVAVGCKNGLCVVFEINTGHEFWRCCDINDAVTCLGPYFDESSACIIGCVIGSLNGSIMVANFQERNHNSTNIYQEATTAATFKGNIIVGANSGEMFVISLSTFKPYSIPAHQSAITKCLVMQDQLITTSKDHSLKIWHMDEDFHLTQHLSLPHCHGDWVTACAFTDNILITGSQDCTVKLWEVGTWTNKAILSELKSPINHLALEGNYIIAGTRDGSVGVWSKQGSFVTALPSLENSEFIHVEHTSKSVSSKNGEVYHHLLATADENDHLIIRKPFSKKLLATLSCQSSPISSFCITSEYRILSCSINDKVQFWKLENYAKCTKQYRVHHKTAITAVDISPNGKFGLSTDAKGKLILWTINLSSEDTLCYSLEKEWKDGFIPTAMFVQSGVHLYIICAVNKIEENDSAEHIVVSLKLTQGEIVKLEESGYFSFFDEVLSMDSSSRNIGIGFKSGTIVITDKLLKARKVIDASDNWIIGTAFPTDSSSDLYATVSSGILKLESCNSRHPKVENWKDFSNDIIWPNSFCVANDKCYIGTSDGFLHIFSEEFSWMHKVHSGTVNDISVCCNFIFTCSDDNSIKVWEVESLKQVGQFHYPLPVTVLITHPTISLAGESDKIIVMCGTKIGEVHILTWSS